MHLRPSQQQILELLENEGPHSVDEMKKRLKKSGQYIYDQVRFLANNDLITKINDRYFFGPESRYSNPNVPPHLPLFPDSFITYCQTNPIPKFHRVEDTEDVLKDAMDGVRKYAYVIANNANPNKGQPHTTEPNMETVQTYMHYIKQWCESFGKSSN